MYRQYRALDSIASQPESDLGRRQRLILDKKKARQTMFAGLHKS
jgi:hypothetical protein